MFVGINLGINQLRGSVSFSPASLFALGEPGVWFDPSDVANLAWRRNLLEQTEDLSNAYWTAVGATSRVVSGSFTTFTENTSSGVHSISRPSVITPTAYTNFTLFASFRAGTRRYVQFQFDNGTQAVGVVVDTQAWSVTPITGAGTVTSYSIVQEDASTYRVTVSGIYTSGTFVANAAVYGLSSATQNSVTYTGNSSTFIVGKLQLELGSTATDYQRISDVNTEVIERFPNATLYQDPAGTTPVTTPGQTVGLMLDKSKGLVLGAELVTNGDFATNVSGWSILTGSGGSISWVSSEKARLQDTAINTGSVFFGRAITTEVGKSYTLSGNATAFVNTMVALFKSDNTAISSNVVTSNFPAEGNHKLIFTATATTTYIGGTIYASGGIATADFDNISVRELPGNHATQATPTARPNYGIEPVGGRRNLLTWSEDFGNAAWLKVSATVPATQYLAPDGTTTADLLYPTSTGSSRSVYQTVNAGNTTSVYAKASGSSHLWIIDTSGSNIAAWFNLSTGIKGTVASGYTHDMVSVGNGWYRCTLRANSGTFVYGQIGLSDADNSATATVSGTNGILIWGAQLELGSTATAYQRTTTQYDVTEAGVASTSYLAFDGVDDGMVTGTITPGIDKAQVFTGVRKLTDAAAGSVMDFGEALAGSFNVLAPGSAAGGFAGKYFAASSGSIRVTVDPTGFAAPTTNVLATVGDISGDTLTLRVNGTQVAQATTDQGTGNYLAYRLYIGTRGGTTLYFKGNLYSLITRFGPNLPANTITSTERWIAGKTGFYPPIITGVPTIGVS